MKRPNLAAAAVISCLSLAFATQPATAHFQLLYTPEVNLKKAADVLFKLIFWHPFENGHVMAMGQPEQFFMVHKGKKTDLLDKLEPITFTGASNQAAAYQANVPLKRVGDYILTIVPAPYYEESEGIFIQQVTKSFVNRGGVPTGWNEPLGLDVEIVPLNKPTNILAGSTFTGRLLSQGNPVPGADVEVEFMAAVPNMDSNTPQAPTASPMPGGAIVAKTDINGYFSFGIPKAGFWGFAALGAGPKKEHEGKPLSHDAVLWVRAYDVR